MTCTLTQAIGACTAVLITVVLFVIWVGASTAKVITIIIIYYSFILCTNVQYVHNI